MTDQTDSDIFRFPDDREYFILPSPDTECTVDAKRLATFFASTLVNLPNDENALLPRTEDEAELARQIELDFKTGPLTGTIVGTEGGRWTVTHPAIDENLFNLIDSKNGMVVVSLELFPGIVFPGKAMPVSIIDGLVSWDPEEYILRNGQVTEYEA